MNPLSPSGRPWLGRFVFLACGLVAAPASVAQVPAGSDACSAGLAEAQRRYVAQEYASVEALVLPCVDGTGAPLEQIRQGYRLLTLAFIRQDLLHDAQATIVKLIGLDFDYAPDPVQDPPLYVALVASIKDQLRVAPSAAAPAAPAARVNVNLATAAELEAVPGIGPALASRIIARREREGPFQRVEDLDDVAGIGPQTLQRLAPYLTTDPAGWTQRAAGGVSADAVGTAPATVLSRPEDGRPAPAAGPLINLNTASAEELEALDGIGPSLAARIVAYREQVGPFQRVEEVLEVRGIGPRTLERFAHRVTVVR